MELTTLSSKALGKIEVAFKNTFQQVCVFCDIVLPQFSAGLQRVDQIDCVVVCEVGVFVFEVKDWGNQIFVERMSVPGQDKKQWVLRTHDGIENYVPDPVSLGSEKALKLRTMLTSKVLVFSYVVVDGEDVELSGRLPASTVCTSDLPFLARIIRSQSKRVKKPMVLGIERFQETSRTIASMAAGQNGSPFLSDFSAAEV